MDSGTAADFRQLAEAAAWTEPERVQLAKSGVGVMLRRPTKFYLGAAPRGLARAAAGEDGSDRRRREARTHRGRNRCFWSRKIARCSKQPSSRQQFRSRPGTEQFDAAFLHEEDLEFVLKHLRGQVLADGQIWRRFLEANKALLTEAAQLGRIYGRLPVEMLSQSVVSWRITERATELSFDSEEQASGVSTEDIYW